MSKHKRYRSAEKTFGTSPGTLTYIGEDIEHAIKIKRIKYNADEYHIDDNSKLSACQLPDTGTPFVNWTDVDGIHKTKVIAALGQRYHLHTLLLEDVINVEQKPKIELYDAPPAQDSETSSGPVVFVTLKMLHHNQEQQIIEAEHVSLVLGENYLLSFQEERTHDIFDPVIERIKASSGKTRRNGPDYLMYSLMDLIVDHYSVVVERISDKIDELEEEIVKEATDREILNRLYRLKRELGYIRRTILPVREIMSVLLREDSSLIKASTVPFLRDLSDHVNQTVETLDSQRDIISGLMDVYYSIVNNRMNSVMKTLTIVSAIFIPLTFIVGVYGMNFDHMPELHSRTGYFWVWTAMVAIAIGEVIYFKRRGWM
ncbi:magnesium/cobalt transporter CorA [Spirosoma pomorum]|jgi:magnesium transporter